MKISRLTRDGTAELVSRDQILRRGRGQEKFPCPADHEQDWQFLYTILLYRSLELLAQKYSIISLLLFWCPYVVINVSVQCNGGLLPDIILLTLFD